MHRCKQRGVVPINTDGVADMTGLACIQHHMQQADGLCGTTLQLQSQYEWKFYARWHGHETVGKDSKAVRPSNIWQITQNKWLDCCNVIFWSHIMLLGNPHGGAKVAVKNVILICLAMRDQPATLQCLGL
jgi:hypothetical protein